MVFSEVGKDPQAALLENEKGYNHLEVASLSLLPF